MCTNSHETGCCNVIWGGECSDKCEAGYSGDKDHICRKFVSRPHPVAMWLVPALHSLTGMQCTNPPPTLISQSYTLDEEDCTYEGCTATYTCNTGLTLAGGGTSYQLTCMVMGPDLVEWAGETQACSKELACQNSTCIHPCTIFVSI